MRTRFLIFPLLFCSLLFTSCDSDGGNGDGDGDDLTSATFTITITGDISQTFTGRAIFSSGTDPESGEQAFGLFLTETVSNGGVGQFLYILNANASAPDEGTYSFANADDDDFSFGDLTSNQYAGAYFITGTTSATVALSNSGTFTISDSSSNKLTGSFNFTATGFDITGGQQQEINITVSGSFNAVGGSFLGGLPL